MTVYPYSRLFIGDRFSIAISGPHIQVLDSVSDVTNSGPIRCAAIDQGWTYIATCGDDKQLKVWKIDGLKLLNQRELPKKPTNIAFTKDAQTIIVSDKFGDVFSYPLEYNPPSEKQKRDALSSHENPSDGKLILGHVSVLTTFLLSQDEGYIITADRDEHIRVSWYPQGFVIEIYCLGHEKYVSAIHTPSFSPSTLISGGGDPMLKIWDWMSGTVQYEIPILDAVRPFITVIPQPKRGVDEEDEDQGKLEGKSKGKRQGKGKKGKEKAVEEGERETSEIAEGDGSAINAQPRQVLVVHKISSVQHAEEPYLVFNAVGATALFVCPLKPDAQVQPFDFSKPVLDFVCNNGLIWVLLDGNWNQLGTQEAPVTSLVRVLYMTPTGELAEAASEQLGSSTALLTSLNSTERLTKRLTATVAELKKLNLYTDLTWLPKHNEGIDPETSDKPERATSEMRAPTEADMDGDQEKQMTKRELARLKNKKKVLAKAQEAANKDVGVVEEDGGDDEPVPKKNKSEREEDPMEVDSPGT
ncbi:hypothetical protein M378DRAFT_184523 [Amanita muscaria Koide BX008]|uniref:Uncharacterized protein n=1 Tax=Amanita muscaria (strain Koide BX008) TaxID=946122 RepID=A0A0C2XJU8_AMAMK|nr:hypothetical protein M378DRAFT_184523 [Amanita muscaria Koide BX008]